MEKQLYADGMTSISLSGGVVRMELYRSEDPSDENEEKEILTQLLLPPQGFIDSFVAMYKLVNRLSQDGVIELPELPPLETAAPVQHREESDSPVPAQQPAVKPMEDDDFGSPNFE